MPDAEFEKLVADGYAKLPDWVRQRISNVALLVESEPSSEDRNREGLQENETLLGLYKGVPLSARGDTSGIGATLPDTITLYKQPILEAAQEELPPGYTSTQFADKVSKIVADTVWHEFAHHFGMDEDEVRSREAHLHN